MQVISMVYGLRHIPASDLLTTNFQLWKDIFINTILALTLTLKMAVVAPSLTFFD